MDWFKEALEIFACEKPEHFGNYRHCCECEEHDAVLRDSDVFSIGLNELGNPGWDPICFSHPEGIIYYMPAMIRLAVETMDDEFYLSQLLFHLEYDGQGNRLYQACNAKQREFIANFMDWLILNHAEKLTNQVCENEAFRVWEIWSNIEQ